MLLLCTIIARGRRRRGDDGVLAALRFVIREKMREEEASAIGSRHGNALGGVTVSKHKRSRVSMAIATTSFHAPAEYPTIRRHNPSVETRGNGIAEEKKD